MKELEKVLDYKFKNIDSRLENIRKANNKLETIIEERNVLTKEKEQER